MQIEDVKKAIKTLSAETPVPTTPPTTPPPATPPPTTTPPPTSILDNPVLLGILSFVVTLVGLILAFFGINVEKVRTWLRRMGPESPSAPTLPEKESTVFKYEYDIAISFAGEDREIAKNLAKKLGKKKIQNRKVKVFYDEFLKSQLWGKELAEYFQKVYGPDSRFVVLLLSRYYPVKKWTDFEFSIMREEAKKRKTEFILPVELDETRMEGMKDVAYLDFQKEGIDGIVDCLLKKLLEPLDQDQEPYGDAK